MACGNAHQRVARGSTRSAARCASGAPSTQGNRHIRAAQYRRVVEAVADHRHDTATGLQCAHHARAWLPATAARRGDGDANARASASHRPLGVAAGQMHRAGRVCRNDLTAALASGRAASCTSKRANAWRAVAQPDGAVIGSVGGETAPGRCASGWPSTRPAMPWPGTRTSSEAMTRWPRCRGTRWRAGGRCRAPARRPVKCACGCRRRRRGPCVPADGRARR